MPAKKIAIIHPSSELYGADRILVEALKNLDSSTEKHVYLRADGPLVNYITENVEKVEIKIIPFLPIIAKKDFGVKGIATFFFHLIKFHLFIRKEQRREAFSAFYLNTFATAFVLLNLIGIKTKRVVHVHEIIDSPKLMNWTLSKLSNQLSDLVICVSEAVRSNIVKHLKKDHKVVVLHNGIPKINVNKLASSQDSIRFYLFGRIMPKKGQWLLIEALAKIPGALLANHKFIIVGGVLEGHEFLLEDLKKKINAAKLNDHIEMLPFCDDISPLMSDASVCLVPSVMKDPFPTTVLEAMSAGRMVIASDSGGAVEAIEDGKSGFLFAANDSDSLKERIEATLREPQITTRIGRQASLRFERFFSTSIFAQNWTKLHNKYQTEML